MIYTDLNNLERYLGIGKHLDTAIHYIKEHSLNDLKKDVMKLTEILHLSTVSNTKHYRKIKHFLRHMRNMQISIW